MAFGSVGLRVLVLTDVLPARWFQEALRGARHSRTVISEVPKSVTYVILLGFRV